MGGNCVVFFFVTKPHHLNLQGWINLIMLWSSLVGIKANAETLNEHLNHLIHLIQSRRPLMVQKQFQNESCVNICSVTWPIA